MNKIRHISVIGLTAVFIILVIESCSTARNTAATRWWQAFNSRYNTYYNGAVAYVDGSLEKENGNQDNYTDFIPLYTVRNKNSKELGKANFDRAILKAEKVIDRHSIKQRPQWKSNRRKTDRDREWLSRKEYNPFMWKAWMLLGRSQFHEGNLDNAISTFAYMSMLYRTQPAIYSRAQAWLAKCYIENDLAYDAEDVIRNNRRDSIPWQARKDWDLALADYYLLTHDYKSAIPYLRNVIRREKRRKQKAREWFIMGQICQAAGKNVEAYKAYSKVIAMNPPYGGSTEASIKGNFPMDMRSSETADLFMVLIMYRLKRNGRAAVIVPDGFLFGVDGAKLAIKTKMLKEFNLHTIIRLPGSIFAPYTSIATNILFFNNERADGASEGYATRETWFYRLDMPEGYKHFSKTKPMKLEHCKPIEDWWGDRKEIIVEEGNEKSRKFSAEELVSMDCNFDQCKFPKEEEEVLPPAELLSDYFKKRKALDYEIDKTLAEIQRILGIEIKPEE